MKNIVIIGTYPEYGSKNIGDQLITNALCEIVKSQINDARIKIVWRAESWGKVESCLVNADHVFFACLAIRPFMHKKEYPYLERLVDSGVPFSVIASGTDLPVTSFGGVFSGFSGESISLLKKINSKATVLTTRGVLTQEFCNHHGLSNFKFSGDVAFYDSRFSNRSFRYNNEIRRVVISDPHRSDVYLDSLSALYKGMRSLFPSASILIAQHGIDERLVKFCTERDMRLIKIYNERDSGLDIYDEVDIHVGFRVHAHVSALKRRVYSYLLEQDGRGCDYGLTMRRKISIPNYFGAKHSVVWRSASSLFLGRSLRNKFCAASSVPAEEMIALIRNDASDGFEKFLGLEKEIEVFNENSISSVKEALRNERGL